MTPLLRFAKKTFCALDFGARTVTAVLAEKEGGKGFRVLGFGSAPAEGVIAGSVVHAGDAAEAVVEALRAAENRSGARAGTVYFNFDDPEMESVDSRGSKFLKGEGQIRAADIREAGRTAERLAGHFEKSIIYSREVDFLVDDRDPLSDPLGIYGRKLEVRLHILLARAILQEMWLRVVRRALVREAVPVLSAWSTAYGILPREDRNRKRLILDLGRDFLNIFIFGNNIISEYTTSLYRETAFDPVFRKIEADSRRLIEKEKAVEEILVTGELAEEEEIFGRLREAFSLPVRLSPPSGIAALDRPRLASLAGLLFVADELESRVPILRREKGWLVNAKEKALSFIHEYF